MKERAEADQKLGQRAREIFDEAVRRLVQEQYDRPIMSNLVRPGYVEYVIAAALTGEWKLVSADWSGWDFENKRNGARLEVKQSAALQTWRKRPELKGRTTRASFDIAPRRGFFVESGMRWVPYQGRPADLYVFAWHPEEDEDHADQRDPEQWCFFVVPEHKLPAQKTIALARIKGLAEKPVGFDGLHKAIARGLESLPRLKCQEQPET